METDGKSLLKRWREESRTTSVGPDRWGFTCGRSSQTQTCLSVTAVVVVFKACLSQMQTLREEVSAKAPQLADSKSRGAPNS